MSGIRTSQPITLIRAERGLDIETYHDELDCVLHIINNGRLGRGIDDKAIGWGSAAHKKALEKVIEHCAKVKEAMAEQDEKDRLDEQAACEREQKKVNNGGE